MQNYWCKLYTTLSLILTNQITFLFLTLSFTWVNHKIQKIEYFSKVSIQLSQNFNAGLSLTLGCLFLPLNYIASNAMMEKLDSPLFIDICKYVERSPLFSFLLILHSKFYSLLLVEIISQYWCLVLITF